MTEPTRGTVVPVPARLLDIGAAAEYLGGVSTWTVRALIADGHLRPVRLPSVRHRGETGRRLLLDVRDLDVLVDRLRETASAAPDAQLSAAALMGWDQRRQREIKRAG